MFKFKLEFRGLPYTVRTCLWDPFCTITPHGPHTESEIIRIHSNLKSVLGRIANAN